MSNIKLKDHYWETEGIYDTAQTATQKAINGEVVESARNIIKVQDTQPTSTYNKIWLPETVGEGVQVPTWAEHQVLSGAINNCVTNVKYDGGYLKKTINGTDSNIIQIQDTPTNESSKLPSSKSVYNLSSSLDSLHKIFTSVSEIGLSGTPTLVEVALALPNGSMFLSDASAVAMTDMTDYNQINMLVVCRATSARVFALGMRTFAGVVLSNSDIYYASFNATTHVFNGWISLNRGKLNTAGGTMTGNLVHSNSESQFRDANLVLGTVPSTSTWTKGIRLQDKNGAQFGGIGGFYFADGSVGVQVGARYGDGQQNVLRIRVTEGGVKTIDLDSGSWRTALGINNVNNTTDANKPISTATQTALNNKLNSSDFYYAVNNTLSITASALYAGLLTDGSKIVYFDVDTPKSMKNISTISVTSLTGAFRSCTGAYMDHWGNQQWVGVSGYTITGTKLSDNRIRIAVTKTAVWKEITSSSGTIGNTIATNVMVTYWGPITLKFT